MFNSSTGFSPHVKTITLHPESNPNYLQRKDELDHALKIIDLSITKMGNVLQLMGFVSSRFSIPTDSMKHWQLSQSSYVVTIPRCLSITTVYGELTVWGARNDWWILHYDPEAKTKKYNECYRVQLQLRQFPLECWEKEYIKQVVALMGTYQSVNENDLNSTNRMALEVEITCADPWDIPKYILVGYEGRRKKCRVYILQWMLEMWVPQQISHAEYEGDIPEWSSDNDGEDDEKDKQIRKRFIGRHQNIIRYYMRHPPGESSSPSEDS